MAEYVFKLPDLGEGTVEAEIIEWRVKPGEQVREGQVIADVMSDKANIEMPAPVSGTVLRVTGGPGEVLPVGAELAAFETSAEAPTPTPGPYPEARAEPQAPASAPPEPPAASQPSARRVLASPAIRRRAKEAGVDLASITGTGPRGRILQEDLDARLAEPAAATQASEFSEHAVTGMRRVIARRMSQSSRDIPHFSYVEEVDVTELELLRQHLNDKPQAERLTPLPFIALALLRALEAFPEFNATFDADSERIRRYRSVHLGIATHTPDGLKVPVVRQAERRDLADLGNAIQRAAQGARENSLRPQELTGSTITLTSLGALGGISSTPIINAPEVAIIGVNRAAQRPVVFQGQVAVRRMMNLSSSFDHRFVDGHDAARFIARIKTHLEHPATLFMPV